MNLQQKNIVLTGATGGIGSEIAKQLDALGSQLILTDRGDEALQALAAELSGSHTTLPLDLTRAEDRAVLVEHCTNSGTIDAVINSAGVMDFHFVEDMCEAHLQLIWQVNVMMPMLLIQSLLPLLRANPKESVIVNVGSTFGSIGFPGFGAYCSSKFALRGFTETLRRELADSPIEVCYIAPRATQTKLNSDAITQMNESLKNAMDPPEKVAKVVIKAMQKKHQNCYIGWPEKLFVKINGLFPKLVDNALKKQLSTIRHYSKK